MVHDFVHVPLDFSLALARARQVVPHRLPEAANAAWTAAQDLYRELEPEVAHSMPSGPPRVDTRPIRQGDQSLVIPVRWGVDVAGVMHPVMDANVELTPLGSGVSHLTIWGTGHPPAVPLHSPLLDRNIVDRVAEHSARAFLHKLNAILVEVPPNARPEGR